MSVPPFATGVAKVSDTVEALVEVKPVTVSSAAGPPDGVYVTE